MTLKSENNPIVQTARGKAFSTIWHSMHIPWHQQLDQTAFTIELWACRS